MAKITRAANGEGVFSPSVRMDRENLAELKTLFDSEASGRRITLDLKGADSSGPRRRQFSYALRSRQHTTQELPGTHP
jgi:hypothetical protein